VLSANFGTIELTYRLDNIRLKTDHGGVGVMVNISTRSTRRGFLRTSALAAVAAGLGSQAACLARGGEGAAAEQRVPLKIGIRAASLGLAGSLDAVRAAACLPGIRGVELQTTAGNPNLRDWDTARRYKREASRWGIHIPSIAGVWDRGVKIHSPNAADSLLASIRAAEILGATVVLVAFFEEDAPDMASESSYGRIVAMLQKTAKAAADAGVVLGLENSLCPADNKKLVDLVDDPAVGVYYDVHNMAHYGHQDQAIPGIHLLGKQRICMVHVKNGESLLEEPGLIDWAAAIRALNEIEYEGWYIYETKHTGMKDCIEDTKRNNAFLQRHARGP
jgi:sugar phosphate isomerase/epimerase